MVHQLLILHERLLAEVTSARLARLVRRQGPLQRHCGRRRGRRGAFGFSYLVFNGMELSLSSSAFNQSFESNT